MINENPQAQGYQIEEASFSKDHSMENMMRGNVLGSSPSFLNSIKLQAMLAAGGFHNHPPEASTQEYVCPTSSSVNDIPLQYDVIPFTEQSLHHTMSHHPLLPLSSSMSPQLLTAAEDVALINHLRLAHADSASLPYMISCEKERTQQDEELAAGLLSSLPTCGSFLGPHHSPHSYPTSLVQYASCGFGPRSDLSNPGTALAQQHVQDDAHGCLLASKNLSFLKDHHTISHPSRDYMNCLMTNDGGQQEPSTAACSMDGGNLHMSTSSSSSTQTSISSGLTQLTKENLQVWSTAFDSSSSHNYPVRDLLYDVHGGQVGAVEIDVPVKNEDGMVQHIVNDKCKSSRSLHAVNHVGGTADEEDNVVLQKKMKRRKRKRMSHKNVEEMETQRMTHIAVERNRRKQMNEHLRALRLLMPSSYIQRGDQASIVGGTIRFVEELEQVIQSLRLQKQLQAHHTTSYGSHFQKYHEQHVEETYASTRSCIANVEVTMLTSSTMFMKVLAQKKPNQLFHTLLALSNLCLRVTNLNITTLGLIIVYTFNLEVDGDCQIITPFGLAESIQHMFVKEIEANGAMTLM